MGYVLLTAWHMGSGQNCESGCHLWSEREREGGGEERERDSGREAGS